MLILAVLLQVGKVYVEQRGLEEREWKSWFSDLIQASDLYLSKVILEDTTGKNSVHFKCINNHSTVMPQHVSYSRYSR